MAAVAACGGFGAVCGSSLAAAATMGKVALILMLSALALFVPRLIGG